MTIERIELSLLELPYVHFFETSFGREEGRTFILVKVLSQGLSGYGEVVACKSPLYSYETTSTAWLILQDILIPMIFDEEIDEPEGFAIRARTYKGHPMAKSGMEQALWDLKAKKAGLPLWKLYGGDKPEVISGVSIGIQNNLPQLLERIDSFLKEGYPRVKIKIKPGWDLHICREVRKVHPHLTLQVDANAAYTLADKDILKKMDDFDLQMLEQPFFSGDLWDHSLLQKEIKTPLCLDESAVSLDAVRQAHAMQSCRIINIKVGRVGGIREALRIHDYCLEKNMPVWCGGMMESGIGRAHNLHLASMPNFKLANDISASKRYYAEDLIDPPVDLTTWGTIKVPQEPGIGVSPQEDRIKKVTLHHQVFKPGM